MAELGKAYIEVRADLSKFPAELRAKLKAAFKESLAGVEFKELGEKAEKAGEEAGRRAGRGFGKTGGKSIAKEAEKAGKGILNSLIKFFDSRRSNDSNSLFGSISGAISGGISDGLKQGQSAFESIGQIGSKIGDVGGEIGSAAKLIGITLLIPLAIQAAGALVQLGAAVFALPAALGVAAAAFAPLLIAFQGFGEAVSAGLSGNVDKFNTALKGLPPAMRSVVKEVVGLKSVFGGLKDSIQQAFFKPLVGVVGPALRTIIATVAPGLTQIAGSLGQVAAQILKVFAAPENLKTYAALLASTNKIVQTMGPALGKIAQGMMNLIAPALPFLERGAAAFQTLATEFEQFTRGAAKGGELTTWLTKAFNILKDLGTVAKEAGKFIITALGGEVGDQGASFIHDLGDEFKRLNEFIKSKEGRTELHNLTVVLKGFGAVALFLIGLYPALANGFNLFFSSVRTLLAAFQAIGAGFVWLVRVISNFVKTAGSAIADFFTKDIPRWFNAAVSWFEELPDRILKALSNLASSGRDFLTNALQSWYDAVFTAIGRIIGVFLATPYLIQQGLDAIPGLLADAGNAILTFFEDLGSSIGSFFTDTLPALFTTSMKFIGDLLSSLWNDTITNVRNIVVGGFNAVVDFLDSLPTRVAALGARMYNAAIGLGRRLAEGLSSIGDFASDLGKKVANALKSAINWVIGKINSGIADIDNKLPVDLPRIPQLARGAIVDRPTLALVGERGPEAVIPLTNAQRAQQLAEESGLVDLLKMGRQSNAVSVVVYLDPSGVIVPTVRTVVNGTLDRQGDELAYARDS